MPSKIKAIPLRVSDQTKSNIGQVAKETGKSAHAATVLLIEEALTARGLGSPGFTRIAAGLKEVEAFVTGETELPVYSPRTGKTKVMNIKQAKAEQKRVTSTKPETMKPHVNERGEQIGARKPAYGELAKGVTKPRERWK